MSNSNYNNDTKPCTENSASISKDASDPNTEKVTTTRHDMTTKVLLRVVNVRLYGQNSFIDTVALLDEASTVTFVDELIVAELGIEGQREPSCIQWTNNIVNQHDTSLKFDIKISGCYRDAKIFTLKNVHSVKDLSLPFQTITGEDWMKYDYLQGLPFQNITRRPMILLGQDNINLTVARKASVKRCYSLSTRKTVGCLLVAGLSLTEPDGSRGGNPR
ncbi:hypothetical protein JTB14_035924 [Gonioctena quinquepunctata]|nr:hypothetical protein JTB14_035924 [Gonioctena quinquepunctata]